MVNFMTRILLASVLFLETVACEAQTFACQYSASGGLDWRSGQWESTQFKTSEPFFLTIAPDKGITSFKGDSIMERLPLNCDKKARELKIHSCSSGAGAFVYFWEATQRGAISKLFGSVMEKDERDSLSVQPFICQKI